MQLDNSGRKKESEGGQVVKGEFKPHLNCSEQRREVE